ncbi:uncharacterized protein LOC111010535 [Momordica charantia]|uniref:Uncharacterized protein LOC111010535 n=1 Tax=Momordica charantia TaxID=3673 RepID=A0A6J1CDQ7_MOMCH|nr:uncharacterized protein LOC111010535 [Momordica charantia]
MRYKMSSTTHFNSVRSTVVLLIKLAISEESVSTMIGGIVGQNDVALPISEYPTQAAQLELVGPGCVGVQFPDILTWALQFPFGVMWNFSTWALVEITNSDVSPTESTYFYVSAFLCKCCNFSFLVNRRKLIEIGDKIRRIQNLQGDWVEGRGCEKRG